MVASEVMDTSAAFLNDVAKSIYSYGVQIPYLNIALNELQETLEANNIGITNAVSATFTITTAMFDIGGTTGPALPTDLIEIQALYERDHGTTEDFIEMQRCIFLPEYVVLTQWLIYWTWQNQIIKFKGATSVRDVKIQYISNTLTAVSDSTTPITIINSKSFLAYRTAALCALYIGENQSRADQLNVGASLAIDRMMEINVKGGQGMVVRRRPFMAAFKSRGYI